MTQKNTIYSFNEAYEQQNRNAHNYTDSHLTPLDLFLPPPHNTTSKAKIRALLSPRISI